MAQLFPRSANSVSRASLAAAILLAAAAAGAYEALDRSPYVDERNVVRAQPVPFSHKHHAGQLGIDCRFCHASVEESSFAGIPPVSTCMTCHSQVWTDAAMLEPVREAERTGAPLKWTRVNALPQFVYFDHSIHVRKGIGCASCHGPVGDMPLTWSASSLEMRWCLSCHEEERGRHLVADDRVRRLTDCVACHR